MLDHLKSLGLFSLAELSYLRLEAMDLFERCLTEGSPDYLLAFIEQQIVQEPPRIDLLNDVAEDLHQRLIGLREYHFDVRDRVLRTLRADFHIDLTPIAPPNALNQYHLLELDAVIKLVRKQNPQLTKHEHYLLRQVLEASFEMAQQLHDDVTMTETLFQYVLDWTDGLNTTSAQQYWLQEWEASPRTIIH
jgi:hypothetical protein